MPSLHRMLSLLTLATPLVAQVPVDSVRLYLPMDGHTAWLGTARREPLPFTRDTVAMMPDGKLLAADHPRVVPGRLGSATIFEGGDYWMKHRGTSNWLRPEAALLDDPAVWTASGAAAVSASEDKLVGAAALRVAFGQDGRLVSPPVALRHLEEYHLAAVRVKAVRAGAENVRLTVVDEGLHFLSQSDAVTAGDSWQPVFVRFLIPKGKQPADLRLVLTAAPGAELLADAAMVEQAATHYHDRRSPSSWVPGLQSRGLERCTYAMLPELDVCRAGTLAMFVKPLEELTNSTFAAVGQGWTMPLRLARDLQGRVTGTVGKANLAFGNVPAGQWSHLALTWDGETATAWRDGHQVDQRPYQAADVPDLATMMAAGYQLGIGHDDLGAFSRSTGANAALDEVVLADAAWDEASIQAATGNPGQLAAVFDGPAVDLSAIGRAYGRRMRPVRESFTVSGRPKQVRVAVAGRPKLSADDPAETAPLAFEYRTDELAVGQHQLQVTILGDAKPRIATLTFWIGPHRDDGALPVVGWNVPSDRYAEFAAAGGTVANSSPDVRDAIRSVMAGLGGMWSYSNKATPPLDAPDDWYVTAPDGSRGGVYLAHPDVQARALAEAQADAARAAGFPHLDLVLLNTEWSVSPNFSPAAIRLAKEQTGLDLTWWPLDASILKQYSPQQIETAEAGQGDAQATALRPFNLLPSDKLPAEFQPRDGAIAPDNPLYRYTLWWHRTQSLAAWNDRLATTIRDAAPGLRPLFDPMLRGPSLRRYQRMDYAQEWVYYENPLSMIPVQEALATISDEDMRPTVMPQFLFKAGTSAPISVTPPRDMVIEATWMGCSRPMGMVTYWGWQLVFGPGDMWTTEQYADYFKGLDWEQAKAKLAADKSKSPHLWHPGAWEAFETLGRTLFQPFGKLMMQWENAPRKLAMVKSLASEVFSPERWWTAFAFGPPATAVTATGLPYDLLYDEDVTPEGLAVYDALALPAVTVLPQPALDAVRGFASHGGLVLAEPGFAAHVAGAVAMASWSAESVRAALSAKPATRQLLPDAAPAAVNELVHGAAHYVMAVNDRRVPGPLLGQWGKVDETGVPQTITVGVPAAEAYYELTASREVRPSAGRLALELPAAGGRIVGCYPQRFGRLTIEPAYRGGFLSCQTRLLAADGQPFASRVPLTVTIMRPDGTRHDGSGTWLREGVGGGDERFLADQPGEWRVTVREPLTGSVAEATITVGSRP